MWILKQLQEDKQFWEEIIEYVDDKEAFINAINKKDISAFLIDLNEYQWFKVWDDVEVVSNAFRQDPILKEVWKIRWWNWTIWKQGTIRKIIKIKEDKRIKDPLKIEKIKDFNNFCIYIWDEDWNEFRYHPSELEII